MICIFLFPDVDPLHQSLLGYVFESREELMPFAESHHGPTVQWASETGMYS
jgi:hypothetical protein